MQSTPRHAGVLCVTRRRSRFPLTQIRQSLESPRLDIRAWAHHYDAVLLYSGSESGKPCVVSFDAAVWVQLP